MTYTLRGRANQETGEAMGLFKRKEQREQDIIDLRDKVLAQRPRMPFEFGFPTKCPSCQGRGYVDHIDPFRRTQFEHCTMCGLKWDTSEDEVAALNR
jgi:hypothetical protein